MKFATADSRFKWGMSTNDDIETAFKANILKIPLRAVKTENGQKFVDVLTDVKNNLTERKNITLGLEGDDGLVEVVSGLKEGEQVVTLAKTQ
jgi:hypothetical protein